MVILYGGIKRVMALINKNENTPKSESCWASIILVVLGDSNYSSVIFILRDVE